MVPDRRPNVTNVTAADRFARLLRVSLHDVLSGKVDKQQSWGHGRSGPPIRYRGASVRNVLIPLREGSHSLSGENQHPGHGEDDRRNDQGLAGNRLVIPEVCIA